jgi:hypothetical protein
VGARLQRIVRRIEEQGASEGIPLRNLCIGAWFRFHDKAYRVFAREGEKVKTWRKWGGGGYSWFDADTPIRPEQVLGPEGGD